MTDNRTTELLRKLLDERGLSCQTHYLHVFWRVGSKLYDAVDNLDGTLTVDNLTPEQAVAATLGADDGSRWYELFGTPEQAALNKAAGNWAHVDNLLRGLLEECEKCPDTGCTQYIEKVVKPNMRKVDA